MNFQTIEEVPERIRRLKNVPLDLDQVSAIVSEAHSNSDKPNDFSKAFYDAKQAFMAKHEISPKLGRWVAKKGEA